MLVADMRHYLDLPQLASGPSVRLAAHLSAVVRAATAMGAAVPWVSALPCRRRPGRRPCPATLEVGPAMDDIAWRCPACGDAGTIEGWHGSFFDLSAAGGSWADRSRGARQLAADLEVVATLRTVLMLDVDCERLVYAAAATGDGHAVLSGSPLAFEELADAVASEANAATDRRQRQRLDAAHAVLSA